MINLICEFTSNATKLINKLLSIYRNLLLVCLSCTKELLPFSDTSDKELMQNAISKRIKFAHIDNMPKSVKENFIQKITSETSISKCFNMAYSL